MRLLTATWLLVLALPVAAHAQTETGSTVETEATASEILQSILDIAPERVAKTAKQLLVPEKQQIAWEKESAMTRKRMADQRAECRDVIRKSNRDERMPRILQCQRAMLLLDVNLLRKQAAYTAIIPLLDPEVGAATATAIAALEDAEMAIVDGIDTGLFEREEQLLAARDNLRNTYREPVWSALMKVRIDRELTNLLYVSKLVNERADVDSSSAVPEVALCLQGTAGLLRSNLGALERHAAGKELTAARVEIAQCRGLLRALAEADRQQEKN